jgi:hypothetical protein
MVIYLTRKLFFDNYKKVVFCSNPK